MNILKTQLLVEKDFEAAKVSLSIKPDFNLNDAFRLFDLQGTGTVSP